MKANDIIDNLIADNKTKVVEYITSYFFKDDGYDMYSYLKYENNEYAKWRIRLGLLNIEVYKNGDFLTSFQCKDIEKFKNYFDEVFKSDIRKHKINKISI